jgi:hypothetical protein
MALSRGSNASRDCTQYSHRYCTQYFHRDCTQYFHKFVTELGHHFKVPLPSSTRARMALSEGSNASRGCTQYFHKFVTELGHHFKIPLPSPTRAYQSLTQCLFMLPSWTTISRFPFHHPLVHISLSLNAFSCHLGQPFKDSPSVTHLCISVFHSMPFHVTLGSGFS